MPRRQQWRIIGKGFAYKSLKSGKKMGSETLLKVVDPRWRVNYLTFIPRKK